MLSPDKMVLHDTNYEENARTLQQGGFKRRTKWEPAQGASIVMIRTYNYIFTAN